MLCALFQRELKLKIFYGTVALISLLKYVIVNPRHLGKMNLPGKVVFPDN